MTVGHGNNLTIDPAGGNARADMGWVVRVRPPTGGR
jgi:hypothetical protein